MGIIDELFLAYFDGNLRVKPLLPEKASDDRIAAAEKSLELSEQQTRAFELFLEDYTESYAKSGFSAGFVLAFELIREIFEKPLDKSPQM